MELTPAPRNAEPQLGPDSSPVIPPGYKQTEVGVIPTDWNATCLKSIAAFKSGEGIAVARLASKSSFACVPVFGGNGIAGYTDRHLVHKPTIVIGRVGQRCGEVYLTDVSCSPFFGPGETGVRINRL